MKNPRNFSFREYIAYLLPAIKLERNGNIWENDSIVKEYSIQTTLHKPEQTILNILKPILPNMKMLDIGVGAGRTTIQFAPLVKEYIGIDYLSLIHI